MVVASDHVHTEATTHVHYYDETPSSGTNRCRPMSRMTVLGFLAAYRGYTRDACAFDLRQFTTWCWQQHRQLSMSGRSCQVPLTATSRAPRALLALSTMAASLARRWALN